ncbi:MAG TPA: diguanylate cyclase [Solirubrobacterales bacterium]|nr:diguanylate cyclase [Solirubrobacterales bacterium]
MRFGRRLALFFLLIAIVPTGALIAILLFVSSDSQRGKADARLAAGLQTAVAIYDQDTAGATADAKRIARDPELAGALQVVDPSRLRAFVATAAREPGVTRIEILDNAGRQMAASGPVDSVAFARVGLTEDARPVGAIRLSTTTAGQYTAAVRRLTDREVVLSRGNALLASTVTPPPRMLQPDETADLTVGGVKYRGHAISLDARDGETLLLLGPPKSGGVLGIGPPTLAILALFMVAAVVMAWALARTLTGLHQRVAEQAVTDPLTGLWNRRYMAETLDREVLRAQRFGHPISLIILDVDDFKKINDRRGHMQGDMVLESVADVVREATRSIDVAARYGGDELALILVETGREGALILGDRLGERMRSTQVPLREGGSMGTTISIGVATIPDSAEDVDSLVDAADRALLRAKGAGKNQLRTAPITHPGAPGEKGARTRGGRRKSSERRP